VSAAHAAAKRATTHTRAAAAVEVLSHTTDANELIWLVADHSAAAWTTKQVHAHRAAATLVTAAAVEDRAAAERALRHVCRDVMCVSFDTPRVLHLYAHSSPPLPTRKCIWRRVSARARARVLREERQNASVP
jgi:hypothetical protein